ncbi:hypothetical protein CRYUN_Cryun16bG0009000 [Craigia yunnanensis]
MGLGSNGGDDVVVDDGDGGGVGDGGDCGNGGKSFCSVSCSICLETVTDNGDRSWAKLQCGHQFHLDCIGSAFNIKGAMQCPNCRKIEKGQWLYANGCGSCPEFNVDDWTHDEDLYGLSYSEMSFGVHWCPFGSLARLPSLFEERGEFSSTTYHELLGQHPIFAEHSASAAHPCPYVAYFGPTIHPSFSNSSASVSDSSSFNSHWNGPSVPSEIPTSYAFPATDLHYHSWEHHSPPFSTSSSRIGSSDQPSNPDRSTRSSSDMPRFGSFMHPFLVGRGSGARVGSSVASSLIPPYPGSNARARDRVQALQAYYHQQHPSTSPVIRTPIISGSRRSSSHRSHAQVGPVASSSDQVGGIYFIPSGTSGRNFQEAENSLSTRFHAWDHLPSFSLNQVDRDSGWGAFHQSAGASDPGIRSSSFHQRHGSERTSSQNRS